MTRSMLNRLMGCQKGPHTVPTPSEDLSIMGAPPPTLDSPKEHPSNLLIRPEIRDPKVNRFGELRGDLLRKWGIILLLKSHITRILLFLTPALVFWAIYGSWIFGGQKYMPDEGSLGFSLYWFLVWAICWVAKCARNRIEVLYHAVLSLLLIAPCFGVATLYLHAYATLGTDQYVVENPAAVIAALSITTYAGLALTAIALHRINQRIQKETTSPMQ